jgi:hypothetical protein
MSEKTTPEVTKLLEELKKVAAERDELAKALVSYRQIGSRQAEEKLTRADHPGKGGGYLVRTKLPFWGERMGIQFRNGVGLIAENHERCDELAHTFEHDLGYSVTPVGTSEFDAVLRELANLAQPAKASVVDKYVRNGLVG